MGRKLTLPSWSKREIDGRDCIEVAEETRKLTVLVRSRRGTPGSLPHGRLLHLTDWKHPLMAFAISSRHLRPGRASAIKSTAATSADMRSARPAIRFPRARFVAVAPRAQHFARQSRANRGCARTEPGPLSIRLRLQLLPSRAFVPTRRSLRVAGRQ